jgi:hypothetical protein
MDICDKMLLLCGLEVKPSMYFRGFFFSPTVTCWHRDHILFCARDKQTALKRVEGVSVFVHGCDACCIPVNKNGNTEVSR